MPLVTRFANQGNLYKQTTEPGDWQDGDLWSDTTNDRLYLNINGTATEVGGAVVADEVVMPYSTTIGDYSDPTAAVATSTKAAVEAYNNNTSSGDVILQASGGHGTRHGVKVLAGSSMIGKKCNSVQFEIWTFGTPTGTYQFTIRNSADTIVAQSAAVNVSTLGTTSGTLVTQSLDAKHTLAEGDRILVECSSSSGLKAGFENASSPAGTEETLYNYTPVYVDDSTDATNAIIEETYNANDVFDDDTNTEWSSTAEANPAIYVDCGGSSINIGACAIWFNAETTETQVKIRGSTDTTFTDAENLRTINLTEITTGQYSYLRFNLKNFRYLQIYGSSGSSAVLAINEIKYETYTDAEITETHGHIGIDGDTTGLANNGT